MGYTNKDQEGYDLGIIFIIFVVLIVGLVIGLLIALPETCEEYVLNQTINKDSGFKDYNYQNNNYATGYIAQAGWKNNYTIYTVKGASMEPTMFHNDNIICDNRLEPKLGDIVLINNSMPIAHRIIAEYPEYVITKGDNRINEDDKINKSQIICVVVGVLY